MKLPINVQTELDLVPTWNRRELNMSNFLGHFCITRGGRALLEQWMLNPLDHFPEIEKRQQTIRFIIDHIQILNEMLRNLAVCENSYDLVKGYCDRRKPMLNRVPVDLPEDQMISLSKEERNTAEFRLRKMKIIEFFVTGRALAKNILALDVELLAPDHDKLNALLTPGYQGKIEMGYLSEFFTEFTEDILEKDQIELSNMLVSWRDRKVMEKNFMEILNQLSILGDTFWKIDAFCGLALLAKTHNYVCPQIDPSSPAFIEIKEGRHPLVEVDFQRDFCINSSFVPNDTNLNQKRLVQLLTGPNAGGKSVYMKQVALIVIMAQMGSFVPATEVKMSVFDNIYTCMNREDNIETGESSFIRQQKHIDQKIFPNATNKSLIIMDEIGSGTSGYRDGGEALASAFLLYIEKELNALTLFTTHFEYLPRLPALLKVKTVKNFHPQKKRNGHSSFKIVVGKGVSDGIEAVEKSIPQFNPEVLSLSRQMREIIQKLRHQALKP